MAGRCPQGDSFASRRSVPAIRWSTDVDLPQCHGAQQEDGLLALCELQCGIVEKHGGADVLYQTLGAGEVVLELQPGGGDLKFETAQPPTLNVDDL